MRSERVTRENSFAIGGDLPVCRLGFGTMRLPTGTFTGQMTLPDGTVIPPTGKAFDVEFGQTTKWDGDQLIVISAFWDAALQRQQLGLA